MHVGIFKTYNGNGILRFFIVKTTTGTIKNIFEGGLEGVEVVKKIFRSYNFPYDVFEWCDRLSKYGQWGTTCDIAFISLVQNVKVISLCSINMQVFDSYNYLVI